MRVLCMRDANMISYNTLLFDSTVCLTYAKQTW